VTPPPGRLCYVLHQAKQILPHAPGRVRPLAATAQALTDLRSTNSAVCNRRLSLLSGRQVVILESMNKRTRRTHPITIPSARWLAYAGAGAATSLTGISSADAEIHYSGHIDFTFQHNDTKTVQFSIEPGAFLAFRHDSDFSGDVGAAFFHAEGQQSGAFVGYFIGFEYAYVSRIKGGGNRYISQGYFIADKGGYYFGTMAKAGGKGGAWKKRGTDFVGFRFNNGAGVQYGWARVRTGGQNTNFSYTVMDFAWADPGEKIKPGQRSSSLVETPDEGSLGLLAIGAAGLALWRERRKHSST
jgi:MYXO-CTERM domain-containing protein